jgi:ankyrin repeat protein
MAIKAGQFDVASSLIEPLSKKQVNSIVDEEGYTYVHLAAGASRFCGPLLQQLLAKGASVRKRSKSGATPMHMAAEKGHTKVGAVGAVT